MKRRPELIPLSHQHHDVLALCVAIDRGLKKEPTAEKAHSIRAQALETYELLIQGHFEVEESVLFPAVRRRLPDLALVDELTAEHQSLRRAFENLASLSGADLIAALHCLGGDIERHVRKEERVLFQTIQEELEEPLFEALGKKITASIAKVCLAPTARNG